MATPTPLSILVDPSLMDSPEVNELQRLGHKVESDWDKAAYEGWEHDLILSPRAWRILPEWTKGVEMAVKAARAAKKGKK